MAIHTQQLPVTAIGRIIVVVVITMMHRQLLQILAREFARATPTNMRVHFQRLFTISQFTLLTGTSRSSHDLIQLAIFRFHCITPAVDDYYHYIHPGRGDQNRSIDLCRVRRAHHKSMSCDGRLVRTAHPTVYCQVNQPRSPDATHDCRDAGGSATHGAVAEWNPGARANPSPGFRFTPSGLRFCRSALQARRNRDYP